jgi:hypothetical protein
MSRVLECKLAADNKFCKSVKGAFSNQSQQHGSATTSVTMKVLWKQATLGALLLLGLVIV